MNATGRIFRVALFGESHGPELGVLVDGCPPGLELGPASFAADLARRRAGAPGTTGRHEADLPVLQSGIFQGRTTGTPILIGFRNLDTRPGDYAAFASIPRPGHADFTGRIRYRGFADPRGSGHFSGRLTLGLVAAGVIAKLLLPAMSFETRLLAAGGAELGADGSAAAIEAAIETAAAAGDSVGGLLETRVRGVPAGLGEPFFDSVEGLVAHNLFSVPAVRGVEFGDGFAAARMRGSEHNDRIVSADGRTATNGAGGVNGGITNGNELVFRTAIKPASSIALSQESFNFESSAMATLAIGGRHDACIALRAAVAVEAAAALALADLSLLARGYDAALGGRG